jgi:integrase
LLGILASVGIRVGLRVNAFKQDDVPVARQDEQVAVSEVHGQVVVGPPKSEAGKRRVALPASVVPALRAHLVMYAERGPRGRVFVGEKGATMRRGNFAPIWAAAIREAGLPEGFRFHDLRHTGNMWAAESGANMRELMDRMGHSSMRAAVIDLHATRGASRVIADGIDRQLAAAEKAKSRRRHKGSGT